jgi:predicted glycoside hydrolase/deacetylase ChbG (UPF0249 family)
VIRLIVNADDLGLHPRIDDGIFAAHKDGIVTSATVLISGRSAASAMAQAKAEKVPLGLHLCLTSHLTPAAPAHEVRWLAPGGRFRRSWPELSAAWFAGLIPKDEIRRELRAQLHKAHKLGAKIDHLDSHQHLHWLPGLVELWEEVAFENRLPLRGPNAQPQPRAWRHPAGALKEALLGYISGRTDKIGSPRTWGIAESGRLDRQALLRLLRGLPEGTHELVCHPGRHPGKVPEQPGWHYGWEQELEALCSADVKGVLSERGIELISYGQLEGHA